MKCFKGFDKDLKCRDFQYEEGKEFHTEKEDCCNEGFHACEYPLDCFAYYDPAHSVFHEVELSGEMDKDGNDTKVCATDIKIGARISIAGLVKAAIEFTMSKVNKEGKSDERHGFASATGYYGASSATGNCGASSVSNPTGVAVAWGHEAKAKGCLGAHLILSDWRYIGEKWPDGEYKNPYKVENWEFAGAKMIQVDGENIKEDTFYMLKSGKFVEVD
ncbi:MAG: hypothetical protein [Bacteriophage sp.]|nr:MAG: hypothetical protein [Bacteriophage sp.]